MADSSDDGGPGLEGEPVPSPAEDSPIARFLNSKIAIVGLLTTLVVALTGLTGAVGNLLDEIGSLFGGGDAASVTSPNGDPSTKSSGSTTESTGSITETTEQSTTTITTGPTAEPVVIDIAAVVDIEGEPPAFEYEVKAEGQNPIGVRAGEWTEDIASVTSYTVTAIDRERWRLVDADCDGTSPTTLGIVAISLEPGALARCTFQYASLDREVKEIADYVASLPDLASVEAVRVAADQLMTIDDPFRHTIEAATAPVGGAASLPLSTACWIRYHALLEERFDPPDRTEEATESQDECRTQHLDREDSELGGAETQLAVETSAEDLHDSFSLFTLQLERVPPSVDDEHNVLAASLENLELVAERFEFRHEQEWWNVFYDEPLTNNVVGRQVRRQSYMRVVWAVDDVKVAISTLCNTARDHFDVTCGTNLVSSIDPTERYLAEVDGLVVEARQLAEAVITYHDAWSRELARSPVDSGNQKGQELLSRYRQNNASLNLVFPRDLHGLLSEGYLWGLLGEQARALDARASRLVDFPQSAEVDAWIRVKGKRVIDQIRSVANNVEGYGAEFPTSPADDSGSIDITELRGRANEVGSAHRELDKNVMDFCTVVPDEVNPPVSEADSEGWICG